VPTLGSALLGALARVVLGGERVPCCASGHCPGLAPCLTSWPVTLAQALALGAAVGALLSWHTGGARQATTARWLGPACLAAAAVVGLALAVCGGPTTSGAAGLALLSLAALAPHLVWAARGVQVPRRLMGPKARHRGFALASALVSLVVICLAGALVMQVLLTAQQVRTVQAARVEALGQAVSALEQARLCALTTHRPLPERVGAVRLQWQRGPVERTARVVAEVATAGLGPMRLVAIVPCAASEPGPSAPAARREP
jgi:hypothetical protein